MAAVLAVVGSVARMRPRKMRVVAATCQTVRQALTPLDFAHALPEPKYSVERGPEGTIVARGRYRRGLRHDFWTDW